MEHTLAQLSNKQNLLEIKIKNLNEDELNMLSESIDNILKLIPKIT